MTRTWSYMCWKGSGLFSFELSRIVSDNGLTLDKQMLIERKGVGGVKQRMNGKDRFILSLKSN